MSELRLEHVALVLGARTEQHALRSRLIEVFAFCSEQHHVHEGAEHALEQLVVLRREARLGQRQESRRVRPAWR